MPNTTWTAASSAENATNVTDAKKPETRQRRIEKALALFRSRTLS